MHGNFLSFLGVVAAGCTLGQFGDSELGNVLWLFLREPTTTAALIIFISLGEELVLLNLIRLNGLISWLPVSWAHLTMLISVLESLDQSDGLIHISANCIIIDLDTTNHMLVIEDKHSTNGCSAHWVVFISYEHSIIFTNLLANISKQRVVNGLTQTSLRSWRLQPSQMSEMAITRNTQHFRIKFLELLHAFTECDELSRAHVCEVKWVENKDDPLAFKI